MKQKYRKRLQLIGLMMVFSILLLIQFSVKWLIAQYKDEHQILADNLNELLGKTREKMIDSAIHIEFTTSLPADTLLIQDTPATKIQTISTINRTTTLSFGNQDSISEATQKEIAAHANEVTGEMENGIKRYVIRLNPDLAENIAFMDSGKLLRVFNKVVDSAFHLRADRQTDTNKAIVLDTKLGYYLSVDDYNKFLLKKIGPEVGFVALLICLCSGAFVLAYATLRKQLLLNAHKDNFISNMSHELKTPVATAKVAIEALAKFDGIEDPVKTRDYLQMAGWEIDRLETLVNNVLSNVQLEDGRLHMQYDRVDITSMTQQLLKNMQPLFREKHKHVLLDSDGKTAVVHGDKTHLQGLVYNIIDNALKYGGGNIHVGIHSDTLATKLTISDDGAGIPPAFSNKIFERFFRVPSGDVHDVKGYGLGLNYAKYVAEAHQGSIRQFNIPGGGAAFEITLPLNVAS
ncbi:MAG: HAMP domain-containing sensor histidine kinase [Chitinophagaceae bacterium]